MKIKTIFRRGAFVIAFLFLASLQCAASPATKAESPLHGAVRAGDINKVKTLIGKGADVNALDRRGKAPLHYAAGMCKRKDIVELLLDKGANIEKNSSIFMQHDKGKETEKQNSAGFTPILFAVDNNCADITKLLIDRGANFKIKYEANGNETPLHRAAAVCGAETTSVLIAAGADVNAKDIEGMTPLFMGPLYSGRDRSSDSCLKTAVALLNHGADAYVIDKYGATPLIRRAYDYALYKYEEEARYRPVKLLVDHGAQIDPVTAALLGDADTVKKYLDSGGEEREFQVIKGDPLIGFYHEPVSLLSAATLGDNPEIIDMLIARGDKFTTAGYYKFFAAVQIATEKRKKAALRALLKYTATYPINETASEHSTLYLAVRYANPDKEIIKMLTDNGAKMDVDAAVCLGDKDFVRDFFKKNGKINDLRSSSDTLLMEAVKCNRVDMVNLLIKEGADVNKPYPYVTPLRWAVFAKETDIVKTLIKAGANVNARVDGELTVPLHNAAQQGFVEIAKLLLDNGASVNARDIYGNTPLDFAHSDNMKKLLISRGAVE